MKLLNTLLNGKEAPVLKDTEQIERLAEYYANGDMTEDEFKQAIAQLTPNSILYSTAL